MGEPLTVRREHAIGRVLAWIGLGIATVLAVWVILFFSGSVVAPGGEASSAVRAFVLCASLVGLSIASYLVWPSRWNIPAHTQLAFAVVAYVVPIFFLNGLDIAAPQVLDLYARVIALGFVCCAIGVMVGGAVSNLSGWTPRLKRLATVVDGGEKRNSRRVMAVMLVSIAGMILSFAVMGFVPALAADPFAAKFFRGAYGAAYAPVAPIYRFCTTTIALFLPLVTLYAWKRRTLGWILVFVVALAVMLLSLLRDPAASGVLLCVGVLIALRPRGMMLYFLGLLAVYFVGSALYFVLASFGLEAFSTGSAPSQTWLQEVAAGSPDVSDQLHFLSSWMQRPSYTDGLTFVGGLVPGNFQWNPSVWSLSVVNPGQDISTINSGGLRLPAPIWGLVSFGWVGVVLVSFFSGVFTGILAGLAKRTIPRHGAQGALVLMTVYMALQDVIPVFFRLSYLSVIALILTVVVLLKRHPVETSQFKPGRPPLGGRR